MLSTAYLIVFNSIFLFLQVLRHPLHITCFHSLTPYYYFLVIFSWSSLYFTYSFHSPITTSLPYFSGSEFSSFPFPVSRTFFIYGDILDMCPYKLNCLFYISVVIIISLIRFAYNMLTHGSLEIKLRRLIIFAREKK